jgi:tRNA threonylcarbamoyladenosine biosynthesis protein TsaB
VICLVVETATSTVAAAVAAEGEVLALAERPAERHHVELLHPMILEVCAKADVSIRQLEAVGVDVGPGLFTGIRVGVSAVKGLCLASGLPAVGVTSLAVLEHGARADLPSSPGTVVPVVDLRRGEVAWSVRSGIGWGRPEQLVETLEEAGLGEQRVTFTGGGAIRYQSVLSESVATGGQRRHLGWSLVSKGSGSPSVASLAMLALGELEAGRSLDAAQLEPCYLREADARINWSTRHDGPDRGGS